MQILVVDDSAFARSRIAQTLTSAGHSVIEADGGNAALKLFAETQFDLVTVDMLMPEMDGLELIRRLRALRPDVRIIAISADIQQATRDAVLAAGASEFVNKTAKPEELLKAIQPPAIDAQPAPVMSLLQQDAFTEMINIAMSQAANALAALLERRVLLRVPKVQVLDADGLRAFFNREVYQAGAVIHQGFSGELTGLAALVFPQHHALSLVRVLLAVVRDLNQISAVEQTVLSEVGNVVLNAALAKLGDQFRARLTINLPNVLLNQAGSAATDFLLSAIPQAQSAIVLLSRLTIDDVDLITYLILMLPQRDVEHLLESLGV